MSPLWALICPLMTVNLYLFIGKRLWATDTISSQNKAPRPVWTLVDTWSPNVAGHATDGSLIRHCDSHLFPIQPRLQPLDKPTQLLTHRSPRREQSDRGEEDWMDRRQDTKGWREMVQSSGIKELGNHTQDSEIRFVRFREELIFEVEYSVGLVSKDHHGLIINWCIIHTYWLKCTLYHTAEACTARPKAIA